MFCDSLLDDADWLKAYAHSADGQPMPDDLVRERMATRQPMRAFEERSLAVVPYFEMALYALDDAALAGEAVLGLARDTEQRVLGVESPRPLLAIPHLLNQESAASYQGYLLAEMAVQQTRAHFLRRDGYLTDNPSIGPALAAHYWAPGNSLDLEAMLRRLTGEGFSASYLADACNQSVEEVWAAAEASLAAAAQREPAAGVASLDARIRIVHGDQVLADSTNGEEAMCARFEAWVREQYASTR
jgi:Zn-dependent oligopeptidase